MQFIIEQYMNLCSTLSSGDVNHYIQGDSIQNRKDYP